MNTSDSGEGGLRAPLLLTAVAAVMLTGCAESRSILEKLPEKSKDPEVLGQWVTSAGFTDRGREVAEALRAAGVHGLHPENYTAGLADPDPAVRPGARPRVAGLPDAGSLRPDRAARPV